MIFLNFWHIINIRHYIYYFILNLFVISLRRTSYYFNSW